jgi:hypothetical protein
MRERIAMLDNVRRAATMIVDVQNFYFWEMNSAEPHDRVRTIMNLNYMLPLLRIAYVTPQFVKVVDITPQFNEYYLIEAYLLSDIYKFNTFITSK